MWAAQQTFIVPNLYERNIEAPVYPTLIVPGGALLMSDAEAGLGVHILRFDGQDFLNPQDLPAA
jgi:hypothetical protein